jgi:hypothetical protein
MAGIAAVALLAFVNSASAAEKEKEVTIKGEAKCAKCALHESEKCQTVIQETKGGKAVTYYLADNEVAKKFHSEVCSGPKKVTATGTTTKEGDKHILTVSKISSEKS